MGVQFHAMTDDDYVNLGGYVKATGSADTFGLLSDGLDSSLLFGDNIANSAFCTHLDRANKRVVIQLVKPTFNYVLGRSGMTLLKKILGIRTSTWEHILDMTYVMDATTREIMPMDELEKGHKCLFGAEIAHALIEDFDLDKAAYECVCEMVNSELKDGVDLNSFGKVTIGSGDTLLLGSYYLTIEKPAEVIKSFKRGHNIDTLVYNIREKWLGNSDSRITYLLNVPRDKSSLFGMLNYQVAVVPSEMRPKVQRREHKLTTRYTSVLTTNNELRAVIGANTNIMELREKYLMLDKSVSKLQYKNVGLKGSNIAPDDLSLLERFKSKKGQIRMRNLGKRQDGSFRSVVTISPYLPLDMIQVPECVLPAILETHVLPYLVEELKKNMNDKEHGELYSSLYDKIKLTNLQDKVAQKEIIALIRKHKLLEKIPIPIGRQPTLHKHGIQAFYMEITDSKTIGISPLVVVAFNMDFDGDTAWGKGPRRKGSVIETRDLLLTTQNLYLAKTGECTIEPRHEILYGLYMCTRSKYSLGKPLDKVFDSFAEVREAVITHQIKVWDTVQLSNGRAYIAGDAAFIGCFPKGLVVGRNETPTKDQIQVSEITSKSVSKYVDKLLMRDKDGNLKYHLGTRYASAETFVGAINRVVELGFKTAYFYTTSVSLLHDYKSIPEYDNAIDDFYTDMLPYDEVYDLGLETPENYKMAFDKCLSTLTKKVTDNVFDKLGDENGYVLMSKSGARGKKENLTQMFAVKGQVKKNDVEAFDVLLNNCYVKQLTPLEHFIAGYGGRQGQMDKGLRTGDTGYASRKMWHATQGIWITEKDCGTNEGVTITKNYITKFVDTDSSTYIEDLREIFKHAIVGKFEVGGDLITEEKAEEYANNDGIQKIVVRSPLKCKNPCCAKCYGIDWSTHKKAIVGTAVGLIAAQSLGETMAQLMLNQFHNGGVAAAGQSTSAFDKVNSYLHCADLGKASAKGTYSGYDPLAWETGKVYVTPGNNVRENIVRIGTESKARITVPSNLRLKEYVSKGEGLSYKHGDHSINELIRYCGIDEARLYTVLKLYSLYKSECNICLIHFEIIVTAMTRYMVVSSNRSDLKVGQYYERKELMAGDVSGTVYIPRLISLKELPLVSQSAMDTILMENHSEGLSRVCALQLGDKLEKPLNRMVFGLSIKTGSALPGYIEERKERI